MTAQQDEEILDLVDENDTVLGTIERSRYDEMVKNNLGYLRSVDLLLRNSKGEYWIPTRTATKKIAPNGLDYSMGGHVGAGESYIEAALREIKEELNLILKPSDLIFAKKYAPDIIAYHRSVYLYFTEETPAYNLHDFADAEWLSPGQIEAKLNSGATSKTQLLETVLDMERYITDSLDLT
jgi:8-oxo-dGTP pyrophosphatase MutT (NUDIX family)